MLFPVKRARTKSGKKGVGLKEGEVESCRFFPRWKPAAWFALPEQRASSDSSSCWIHQALRSLYSSFISKWYTQWIVDYTSIAPSSFWAGIRRFRSSFDPNRARCRRFKWPPPERACPLSWDLFHSCNGQQNIKRHCDRRHRQLCERTERCILWAKVYAISLYMLSCGSRLE